ncbi:MAG: 30S ribosomal protein S4 [Acidobacteriota bacterium]
MKYNGPKVRLSRALGIQLTPKAARIMESKPYPPGEHGNNSRRRRRFSGYKEQLLEKQRLKAQYNIHERQMRNYFIKANRRHGNTADNLARLLETRLDAIVYRAGFARTIYAARQYVGHGHIMLNGSRVNIPSCRAKPGDVLTIRQKSRRLSCFRDALMVAMNPPEYLAVDKDQIMARLERLPLREEVPVICDFSKVIEFYSR